MPKSKSAFPTRSKSRTKQSAEGLSSIGTSTGGLTKRELFAAFALQGLLAAHDYMNSSRSPMIYADNAKDLGDALEEALNEEEEWSLQN